MRKFLPLAAALILSAGAAFAQDAPRAGGTLTIALNSDIRSLEPGVNRDNNTDTVILQMFEGLVGYRMDLSVGPALAQSWTLSPDGRAYRFTLRPGVMFQNGTPLTAADVVWSWNRLIGQAGWTCRNYFDGTAGAKVVAVEAPDPQTVVYRLEKPNAMFLKQLANVQCGVLVSSPDSVGKDGTWKTPIGTGPFQFKEWKRDQYITLKRFAGYRSSSAPANGYSGARKAYVDAVKFQVIPDESATEAALETGAIDVLTGLPTEKIAAMKKAGLKVLSAPGLGWYTLLLNTKDPLLSNVKVRRAMAEAIDINQIAAANTGGLVSGNPSAVSNSSAYFSAAFLAWPAYNPKHAAALLKQAGYKGQPIEIETNKRYTDMYNNAVMIQAMLAAAGFNAKLEALDWATQLNNYLNDKFQVQSFGFSGRFDPGLMYAAFLADRSKFQWAQWDDPKALALLDESAATNNEARRKDIFLQLHQMIRQQVPIIGLYYIPVVDAVSPKVQGYQPWGGRPRAWGVWKQN